MNKESVLQREGVTNCVQTSETKRTTPRKEETKDGVAREEEERWKINREASTGLLGAVLQPGEARPNPEARERFLIDGTCRNRSWLPQGRRQLRASPPPTAHPLLSLTTPRTNW